MSALPIEAAPSHDEHLAYLCDAVLLIGEDLAANGEQRDAIYARRKLVVDAIWKAVGRDMVARGQKTKRAGEHVIEAGLQQQRVCECHGSINAQGCDTVGPICLVQVPTLQPTIFIRRTS